jgi:hypothetical protein
MRHRGRPSATSALTAPQNLRIPASVNPRGLPPGSSRPNSHKPGPPNGVKLTEQSQRGSNPCLHLERVVS